MLASNASNASNAPVRHPAGGLDFVNEPYSEPELETLRRSVNRGCPFGDDDWIAEVAEHLGLESTLRPRGRPRKDIDEAIEQEEPWK